MSIEYFHQSANDTRPPMGYTPIHWLLRLLRNLPGWIGNSRRMRKRTQKPQNLRAREIANAGAQRLWAAHDDGQQTITWHQTVCERSMRKLATAGRSRVPGRSSDCSPLPPQIRTCRIPAYGSSVSHRTRDSVSDVRTSRAAAPWRLPMLPALLTHC
jgi:hypothetical protein